MCFGFYTDVLKVISFAGESSARNQVLKTSQLVSDSAISQILTEYRYHRDPESNLPGKTDVKHVSKRINGCGSFGVFRISFFLTHDWSYRRGDSIVSRKWEEASDPATMVPAHHSIVSSAR